MSGEKVAKLEALILGGFNAVGATVFTWGLATGRIVGWGYCVLIAFNAFLAVAMAAKLAVLSVLYSRWSLSLSARIEPPAPTPPTQEEAR